MSWLGALYKTPLMVKMAYLLTLAGVKALHDGVDKRFVVSLRIKASACAQAQCLVQRGLQRVVARFDGAVLIGLARVAAACA